jgi:hypothetical protein
MHLPTHGWSQGVRVRRPRHGHPRPPPAPRVTSRPGAPLALVVAPGITTIPPTGSRRPGPAWRVRGAVGRHRVHEVRPSGNHVRVCTLPRLVGAPSPRRTAARRPRVPLRATTRPSRRAVVRPSPRHHHPHQPSVAATDHQRGVHPSSRTPISHSSDGPTRVRATPTSVGRGVPEPPRPSSARPTTPAPEHRNRGGATRPRGVGWRATGSTFRGSPDGTLPWQRSGRQQDGICREAATVRRGEATSPEALAERRCGSVSAPRPPCTSGWTASEIAWPHPTSRSGRRPRRRWVTSTTRRRSLHPVPSVVRRTSPRTRHPVADPPAAGRTALSRSASITVRGGPGAARVPALLERAPLCAYRSLRCLGPSRPRPAAPGRVGRARTGNLSAFPQVRGLGGVPGRALLHRADSQPRERPAPVLGGTDDAAPR